MWTIEQCSQRAHLDLRDVVDAVHQNERLHQGGEPYDGRCWLRRSSGMWIRWDCVDKSTLMLETGNPSMDLDTSRYLLFRATVQVTFTTIRHQNWLLFARDCKHRMLLRLMQPHYCSSTLSLACSFRSKFILTSNPSNNAWVSLSYFFLINSISFW